MWKARPRVAEGTCWAQGWGSDIEGAMSLLSCLLAVPTCSTSRGSYNFFLHAFRNKKGTDLFFFCVFGGILLGDVCLLWFWGSSAKWFLFLFLLALWSKTDETKRLFMSSYCLCAPEWTLRAFEHFFPLFRTQYGLLKTQEDPSQYD